MFKKKGLLQSQAGGEAGEGVAYLKSWMWWIGMSMMIAGELCNFGGASVYLSPCCVVYLHHFVLEAYAFVEAILVVRLNRLLSTWHQLEMTISTDASRSPLGRHLRHYVSHFPQRTSEPIRVDRLHTMHPRLRDHRS